MITAEVLALEAKPVTPNSIFRYRKIRANLVRKGDRDLKARKASRVRLVRRDQLL
jgi:hypothetical protein